MFIERSSENVTFTFLLTLRIFQNPLVNLNIYISIFRFLTNFQQFEGVVPRKYCFLVCWDILIQNVAHLSMQKSNKKQDNTHNFPKVQCSPSFTFSMCSTRTRWSRGKHLRFCLEEPSILFPFIDFLSPSINFFFPSICLHGSRIWNGKARQQQLFWNLR